MPKKPDLSIIILNYNAKPFLDDCLSSINKQQDLDIQTILVDNNSSDDSVEFVQKNFPHVEIIQRNTSKGFAAGNNRGVEIAKADTILFLNPDMKFRGKKDLKKIYDKYYQEENLGIITPRIHLVVNDKIDDTCHRGFPTPWAALTYFLGLSRIFPKSPLFSQYLMTYKSYDIEHEVDAVGGMFMLMSRKVGDEVNWWDEDYPLYGEDIDFCYRVKEKGYRILYWPEVTVEHHKGASTGRSKSSRKVTTATRKTIKRVKTWSIEAMETFYEKHYTDKYPAPVTWLVKLGIKLLKFKRLHLS